MKHLRYLSLLLAALLLATFTPALGEGEKPDSWISDDLTLTMFYHEDARMPYNPDWGWVEFFKEHTGVTLEIIPVTTDDNIAKANAFIASGSPPDIFTFCQVFQTYYNDGIWVPISDYWDYMPNFKRAADSVNAWETIDNFRMNDGKFYNMPELRAFTVNNLQLFFRDDLMRKYGLENPKTMDEFTEALRTLHKNEPKMRGLHFVDGLQQLGNFVSRMFNDIPMFGNAVNTYHGMTYRDGAYVYGSTSDVARGALEWLSMLNKEGLLDGENLSTARQQMRTFMSNGEYYAQVCYYSDTDVATVAATPVMGDSFAYRVCFPPETPYGRAYSTGTDGKWQYNYNITEYCRQRLGEEKFIQAIQFFDWMRYSETAWNRYTYGIEGVTYDWVDGKAVLNPEYDKDQGGTRSLEADYGCGVLPFRGYSIMERELQGYTPEYAQYQLDTVSLGYIEAQKPPVNFEIEDQDIINQYFPSLKTYVDEMAAKFIYGELEVTDETWAAYVKECATRGATKIQAVYERVQPDGI